MTASRGVPGVVVIGDHVQGLGIIRCLGKRQIPVYLLNEKRLCIGRFSKYLKKFFKSPNLSDQNAYVSFMIELAKKYNMFGFILMPTNDAAVYLLSKNKDKLEEYYKIPTPNYDITDFAYNKKSTLVMAIENDIPIPCTVYPKSINDLNEVLPNIKYPVVVKGIVGHTFYQKIGTKAIIVNSKEELIATYKRVISIIDPSQIMIQEIIPGPTELVYSFCSFFKEGKVIGWWTGRKIRSHPIGFGTGTFVKSVYEPRLLDLGKRILKAMNYYGISEIEFKLDPRDGKFKLIEINARTWLQHSLPARCGVDFPFLLYSDMVGKKVQTIDDFDTDIAWIHIYPDIGIVASLLIKKDMKVKDLITSLRCKKEFAVLSVDDPLPFIAETLILPYLWMKR